MGLEESRKYFKEFNIDSRIIVLDESSATVALAAQALNVAEMRIAKSLLFNVKDRPIMIVVAGDAKIDNRKFKDIFSTKATMMKEDQVISVTTHVVGGICPFGVFNKDMDIYLDESLKRFTSVFPAAGTANSAIELSIPELEKYSNFNDWIDVCKAWQEE